MQIITVHYEKQAAEVFEGVIGFQGGAQVVSIQTYDGKGTMLHLEHNIITRIDSVHLNDENILECSEECLAWYAKEQAAAEAQLAKENTFKPSE